MQPPEKRRITAYGLDRSVVSWALRPEGPNDVLEALDHARRRGLRICPAGGRNSFGDVFLLGEHVSLDMTGMGRILHFDPTARTITVEAGARERDVLALVMPRGFHVPAASGSLWNTVGGNVASNINGKDAWKAGTYGDQVVSFKIVLADGSVRQVDRASDRDLFDAAVGGLGLLGVVTEVTLRLQPIPSVVVETRSRAAMGIAEVVAHFAGLRPEDADFSYAWLDAYPGGWDFGRGVCESARFVESPERPSPEAFERQLLAPEWIYGLRPETFWAVVSRGWRVFHHLGLEGSVFRFLGAVKHHRARRAGERTARVAFPDYQYPMAKLFPHWNLKFAPEGFNEVQALFPLDRFEAGLRSVLAHCRRWGRTPEVAAVRRHRADPYYLSFAGDGLSITLPFSLAGFAPGELERFRHGLMQAILEFGGRVYLAKFPYMEPRVFRQMYPAADRFVAVKARVDPDRLFWSEAAERLLA